MIGVYKIVAIIVMFLIYIQLRTDLMENHRLSKFYHDFQVGSLSPVHINYFILPFSSNSYSQLQLYLPPTTMGKQRHQERTLSSNTKSRKYQDLHSIFLFLTITRMMSSCPFQRPFSLVVLYSTLPFKDLSLLSFSKIINIFLSLESSTFFLIGLFLLEFK